MSATPRSDAALARFDRYCADVRARLERGKTDYGDSSFERPLIELVGEIKQELYDVSGWAFVMWSRLDELERDLREANH